MVCPVECTVATAKYSLQGRYVTNTPTAGSIVTLTNVSKPNEQNTADGSVKTSGAMAQASILAILTMKSLIVADDCFSVQTVPC